MAHHERDSILSNDLSARDEFAVPQDVTFLSSANIGPRLATVRAAERQLGHASAVITPRYAAHDPDAYFAQDAAAMD
jgi:hypothetical protein